MMKLNYIFLLLVIGLTACVDSSDDFVSTENLIDTELQTFVDNFEAEAISRGFDIDVEALGIQVELTDIDQNNVAGACYYSSEHPGRIEIDAPFYNSMSTLQREFVVFHELGHCVLARDHSEAQFNNGTCQSIMASGTGTCRDNYTIRTRTTYIDELFDNAE